MLHEATDYRRAGVIVGVLFIVATAFLFLGEAFYKTYLDGPDTLTKAAANKPIVVFGLLIVSVTPPLNSVGETAAIGAGLSLIYGAIWSSAWGQGRGLLGLERKSSDG